MGRRRSQPPERIARDRQGDPAGRPTRAFVKTSQPFNWPRLPQVNIRDASPFGPASCWRFTVRAAEQKRSLPTYAYVTGSRMRGGRTPSAELTALERSMVYDDPAVHDARRPREVTPPHTQQHRGALPIGVVTFLLTDVVGSTRLWETAPVAMRGALARHDQLMKSAVESHDGVLLRDRGEGDSTFSVFWQATDGAAAALAAQLLLEYEPWPSNCVISVRMAMLTGQASERDGDYYGRSVNRVARLRAIAEGGQILLSQSAAEIIRDHLPTGALHSLGLRELKDFDRPEAVYLLGSQDQSHLSDVPVEEPPTEPVPVVEVPDHLVGPHDAPGPTASVGPSEGEAPSSSKALKAVVEPDRAYYEQLEQDTPFPYGVDPQDFPLTAGVIRIGRQSARSGNDVPIDLPAPCGDPGVSRIHAILEGDAEGFLHADRCRIDERNIPQRPRGEDPERYSR